MLKGNHVEMQMRKRITGDDRLDETVYECTVLPFDKEAEKLFLSLQNADLPVISLDAVYECILDSEEGRIACDGLVTERYRNEYGNALEFSIDNGFYKISIK